MVQVERKAGPAHFSLLLNYIGLQIQDKLQLLSLILSSLHKNLHEVIKLASKL